MADSLEVQLPRRRTLSPDETRALIEAAQAGDREARDALIEGNLRLVLSIVQRFRGRGVDLDDLYQVGCVGLMAAVQKFDLSYDVAFSTYAVPLILGEIHRYLREDRPVHVGRRLRSLSSQVKGVQDRLTQRLGRSPTPEEIGESLGISREEVVMALDADQPPASLEEPVSAADGEGRALTLKDQIADDEDVGSVDGLALAQVLRGLTDVERMIVTLRYLKQMPQTQVALLLACSQAHVSRLEKRTIERMRRMWYA